MKTYKQDTVGSTAVLKLVDAGDPQPAAGEVLIKTRALSVNPVDVAVREGWFPLLGEPPFTLGWDLSGEVVSGDGFEPGEAVFSLVRFPEAGEANAELVAVPADQVAVKPVELSWEQAAALPLVGLTAWQGLITGAKVKAGDRVLVLGAGGGVGHIAVQLAASVGAEVVATASAQKSGFVSGLGAAEVVDYSRPDYLEDIAPVDVVFDTVGGDEARDAAGRLAPNGRFVTIREQRNEELADDIRSQGFEFIGFLVKANGAQLAELAALAASGALRVEVSKVFDFEDLADAHNAVASGHTLGKVAVRVGAQ